MASVDESVTSSGAAIGTIAVVLGIAYVSAALAVPTVIAGITQSYVSTAAATSSVVPAPYATLYSAANAAGTATPTIRVTTTKTSSAVASSTVIAAYLNSATSSAAATDTTYPSTDVLPYVSTGNAVSTSTASTAATTTLSNFAVATSTTIKGLLESATSSAAAAGTAAFYKIASASWTSTGAATSTIVSAGSTKVATLYSTAASTSTATNNVVMTAYVQSLANLGSTVSYRDPLQGAYVMNTETAALSEYTNFAFNSITYMNGKLYATSEDGFYVLEGQNDDGANTNAYIESGYSDLGEQHTKHAGSMYFGYTSDGPIGVDVETYGSGHAKQSYELELRDATSPRNTRVKLGKGLSSRHWRVTVKNKDGSHFELNDAALDVAVSQRRV